MSGDTERAKSPLDPARSRGVHPLGDPGPDPIPSVCIDGLGRDPAAGLTLHEMELEGMRGSATRSAVSITRHHLLTDVPGHAKASLSSRRARLIRDFTVPCGIPNRTAASLVVRPSSTVARSTARNSGDKPSIAAAKSPCSTPRRTNSSAEGCAPEVSHPLAGTGRRRKRSTRRRIPIPQIHAATGPSPRNPAAFRHTPMNVSCTTSSTTSRSEHRRVNRSTNQPA